MFQLLTVVKENVNLTKKLEEGFIRSVYWNEYKSKIETKTAGDNNVITKSRYHQLQFIN